MSSACGTHGAPPRRPGFATVAVALLLAIAGGLLLLAQMAPGAPIQLKDAKETHRRLARVGRALAAHGAVEGRLPCPAEDASGAEGTCAEDGVVAIGFVPHRALGLPVTLARDSWGRMVTYAVTVSLTQAEAWVAGATGDLTLEAGDPGAPARREIGLAWVLVSHGANGAGATMASGDRLPNPSGIGEIENLGRGLDTDPALFRSAPHVLDPTAGDLFDDLVRVGAPP
ncbi:MAG: hypothetical protein K9H25_17075 [Rhodospirillum sp.]|nr:hypothetical protein [Rhodospirillum sp.]MCF8489088.1 hypothetical protein [Rhodospirillum sp.]MCF8503086.1 hypothetical protein [Rhodospirillum sp.]